MSITIDAKPKTSAPQGIVPDRRLACSCSADIQFWRNNKSMMGLSARTVIISFVSQVIVLMYLLDNETSWMIIISAAVGCVIEFWKIGKAMDISVSHLRGFHPWFPTFRTRVRCSADGAE